MSGHSLRFLHTSDVHLEQPLYGVAEIPDHLRDTFLDAPFQAVQQIVDLAIEHEVDFVLLAGDVVQFHQSGPRAAMFLADQFRRLDIKGISVSLRIVIYKPKIGLLSAWNKAEVIKKTG